MLKGGVPPPFFALSHMTHTFVSVRFGPRGDTSGRKGGMSTPFFFFLSVRAGRRGKRGEKRFPLFIGRYQEKLVSHLDRVVMSGEGCFCLKFWLA